MAAVIIMPIGGLKDNLAPDEPSQLSSSASTTSRAGKHAGRFKLWLG
jgi:hypothetical protein